MDNHFDPNHHNTNFNSDTRSQENSQQPSEHAVYSENANNSRTETYVVGKELAHGQEVRSSGEHAFQTYVVNDNAAQADGDGAQPGQTSLYSYSYVNQKQEEYPPQQENRQFYTAYEAPPVDAKKARKQKRARKQRERKPHGFGVKLGRCAAIALVAGLVGGTTFYGTGVIIDRTFGVGSRASAQPQAAVGNQSRKLTTTSTGTKTVVSDVSEVVENVMPSIVSITNLTVQDMQMPFWFGGEEYSREMPTAGSGIIVAQTDQELYIATNNHVVDNASELTVTFEDNQSVAAEIKGVDPATDLAVISVPLDSIPADTLGKIKVAMLGKSESLKVGEPSIAIGNALGYGQSVTTGVISALEREVTVADGNNEPITNSLIQTDAAINPGNSGGALININGEVIGINSVKYSDTNVEGMGYAIPISTAEPIINDLITREAVDESNAAYLGINGISVTDEVSESYNMPKGIYITQVTEGSAADKAGIKPGDIITSFDGRAVTSKEQLAERMQYYAAGTTVDIVIKTAEGGEYAERTISVTLGKKIE